jgi:hypothetical protein
MKFMASHDETAIPAASLYDGKATEIQRLPVVVHRLLARLRSCFNGQLRGV